MDIRIRTIILRVIAAVLLCIQITGCNENTIDSETIASGTITEEASQTDKISETQNTTKATETEISKTEEKTVAEVETSITESEETTAFKDYDENGIKLGIDTSPLTIIQDYEVPELSDSVIKKLEEWRKDNNILIPEAGYINYNSYVVVANTSGEFAGNLQTPHMAIIKGDEVVFIHAYDLMCSNDPMYFIKDDVLYLYDRCVAAGFVKIYFVEISVLTGEKFNEYFERYQLGITELEYSCSTYDNIHCTEDLQNYIYSISDTWFKRMFIDWDDFSGKSSITNGKNSEYDYKTR